MADPIDSIAIIGAGFCGTLTAVNLLQQAHAQPLRIILVDRERHARGAAYAAHPAPFLLNVPAGRMSASSSDPHEFLRFAQRTMPGVTAGDFLPRTLYGDYLEDKLLRAERAAAPHVRLVRVRGEVRSLEVWRPGHTFILGFHDGRELTATEVVLALGNPAPAALPGAAEMRGSTRLVEDPWRGEGVIAEGETLLMVGTGLTMADIVSAAMQTGRTPAMVYAISRHGLVPPGQTAFGHANPQFDSLPLLRAAASSTRALFRAVRQICREMQQRGGDWREAITFVRTLAPKLWARMPARERARFLRHARAYWDVHRHRLPPTTRAAIDGLRAAHRLSVHAGRIMQLQPEGNKVRVTWRPRGQGEPSVLRVDRIINCTGPDYRCDSSRDPLIRNLVANGLIQPDALATGLRTGPQGTVLNLFGRATRGLYYIGPMLRADHWESTAVQELREHAEVLAQELTLRFKARGAMPALRNSRPRDLAAGDQFQ